MNGDGCQNLNGLCQIQGKTNGGTLILISFNPHACLCFMGERVQSVQICTVYIPVTLALKLYVFTVITTINRLLMRACD